MKLPVSLNVKEGHLHIGGEDCIQLASHWGTPLFVIDGDRIVENYRRYINALRAYYARVRVLYAAKANGNIAILRLLSEEGAGADVFSSGEILIALKAGMAPSNLLFNGNSKSAADLTLAVEHNIRVSVDSLDELALLESIAKTHGSTIEVAFRVNPSISVPTHPKIATGLKTSKFGIPHEKILEAYDIALQHDHIQPVGIHCHIGSQILDMGPFARAAEVMVALVQELKDRGVNIKFIDLGGGLGIPYHHDTDPSPGPEDYAAAVMPIITKGMEEANITPEFWVEPGRYLVGDSTVLLTRVNSIKSAHRTFVNIDAGFNLLVRPVLYGAYHEVIVANKASSPPEAYYTLAGPICEAGDLLAEDRHLPRIVAGDLIAILDAGAYGFAMSSQYNGRPRCPELLIEKGRISLIRQRETIDDILRLMEPTTN